MKKINILYIEDESEQRRELVKTLRREGYTVHPCASGKEGLTQIKRLPVDIILCDLNMPDMTGLDVLRQVKRDHSNLPFIMFTAHGSIASAVEAIKNGASHFILKPLVFDELTLTMEQLLETRRIEKKLEQSESTLKLLMENVPDIIYSLDAEGHFTNINPAVERIMGYKPSDVLGTLVFDLIHPDDRPAVRTGFKQAIEDQDETMKILEFRLRTQSGIYKNFEISRLFYFENGEVTRCDGIARDISERKKQEQKLIDHSKTLEKRVHERTQRLEEDNRQLMALNQAAAELATLSTEADLIDYAPRLLTNSLCADIALFWSLEDKHIVLRGAHGRELEAPSTRSLSKHLQSQHSLTREIKDHIKSGTPLISRTAGRRKRLQSLDIAGIKSVIGIPVQVKGKPVGWLEVCRLEKSSPPQPQDVTRIEMFTRLVGLTLETIRGYQHLEQKVKERTSSLQTANKRLEEKAEQLQEATYKLANANVAMLATQEELETKNNTMKDLLQALSESKETIRKAHDELEIRVQERTAELADLNESLRAEVNERKQAETALRQSEARNRALLNAIPDLIFRIDRNGTYLDYQAPPGSELAIPKESVVGRKIENTLPRSLAKKTRRLIVQSLDSGDIQILEYQLHHGNQSRDFEARMVVSGKDEVLAIVRDITEQKRAREALQQAHDELEQRVKERTAELGQTNKTLMAEIAERKQAEKTLATRLQYEEGLAACSRALLKHDDIQIALNESLDVLRRSANAGRVYVFENFVDDNQELCARQVAQVCDPSVDSQFDNPDLQHLPYKEGLSRWRETLSAGKPIKGLTKKLPKSERMILEPHGTVSRLILPIKVQDKWYGFIGFDELETERDWDDQDIRLLQTAAEMIGGYLSRKEAETALRMSERRFRSLVENAHDIIYSMKPNGTFSYISPQFETYTGYRVEDFIGKSFKPLIHPQDLQKLVKTDAEPAAPIKNDYEFRIRHKDGGWRWFITHSTIIRDEQGEVIDGIGIAHDVTEIKQVLQNLEKTNQELRETQAYLVQSEKMASLGMLVAGIAHEINTPIGAINSMHDTLVRGVKKLETTLHSEMGDVLEKHESLTSALEIIEDANRIIKSGSERVSKIVKRLRSFARLDEADLKKADIHEGLDDTLALLHHELKHAIELEKHYGDIPRFSFYPGRLNQVFLNLLVNARQAIPDKGKIIITTYTRDNRAYIEIKDTGQGISKQHLQRIFDPGFTTKGVGVGTGLGLSICYQIIRDHKGEIIVDSKEGVGTTFTVIIPMDLDRNTPTSSQQ